MSVAGQFRQGLEAGTNWIKVDVVADQPKEVLVADKQRPITALKKVPVFTPEAVKPA